MRWDKQWSFGCGGNKVEDFGIGFIPNMETEVDISPIADLTKTEVFSLAAYLNVIDGIQMLNLQMDCGVTGEKMRIKLVRPMQN